MTKTTLETYWIDQGIHAQDSEAVISLAGRIDKAQQDLRHLVWSTIRGVGSWTVSVLSEPLKTGTIEQLISDELYGGIGYKDRTNIPPKTWKRYSAFLVYRQHAINSPNTGSRSTDKIKQ